MRLYKVSLNGDFGDCDGKSLWTQRQSSIPELKRQLREQVNDPEARPEPTVEVVEFQPTLSGILTMLAKHARRG